MYLALSFKYYRASTCLIKEKYNYSELEHVCYRAVHLLENEKYMMFILTKEINSESKIVNSNHEKKGTK